MMAKTSDNTRPQNVKADFDNSQAATSNAGAALIEKTLRSLNLKRTLTDYLPSRKDSAAYSSREVAYPFIAGLLVGGRGMISAEALRLNALDQTIFGLEKGLPSEGTVHNAFADMAGLERRRFDEVYVPSGPTHTALDIFGATKQKPARRRTVPDHPEAARTREELDALTAGFARRCLRAVPQKIVYLNGYALVFGDASQLEVRGGCFDLASIDRNGHQAMQWATLMLGPVTVAQSLDEGAAFEAGRLPDLILAGDSVIEEFKGPRGVLAVNDGAYFHENVIKGYEARVWKYIICANLRRRHLKSLVDGLDDAFWTDMGPDTRRKWVESGTHVFSYRPNKWEREVTIVALRWREADDLPGVWNYSFLATNLTGNDLPKNQIKEHGFGPYVRMLYATKQGREDHYKTALEDFGLHNPPSGRLGVTEVFYALATMAVNAAMVIRYRVLKDSDRGMRFWRFRERYVRLAGQVKRTARTLYVTLMGASVDAAFQTLWSSAFAEAGRL
jgi:hypothetical protein